MFSCSVNNENNAEIIESNSGKIETKNEELDLEKNLYIKPKISENQKDVSFDLDILFDKENKNNYLLQNTISRNDSIKTSYDFELSHNKSSKNTDFEKIEYSTYSSGGNKNLKVFGEEIILYPDTPQSSGVYTFKVKNENNFFNFKVEAKDYFLHLSSTFKDYSWNSENQFEKVIIDFENFGKSLKKFYLVLADNREVKEIFYITKTGEIKKLEFSENFSENKNFFNLTKTEETSFHYQIFLKNDLENISKLKIIFK